MKYKWALAAFIVVVLSGVGTIALRHRMQVASNQPNPPASASSESRSGNNLLQQFGRWLPLMHASAEAARAAVPTQPSSTFGATARARRIADSPEFTAFVKSARFDQDQQRTLARILAVHYENEGALTATASDPERLNSLQRQLLRNTQAQVRVRMGMSDAVWDMFEHSGLLAVAPVGESRDELPAPGQDPT